MRVGDGAVVLLPGEGRQIDVGPFAVTVYADGSTTDDAFSLIETAEPDPGIGPPMHIPRDCAETFYVLAGAYRMFVDDRTFECPTGSFIYIPRGMRHTFVNTAADSRKLNLYNESALDAIAGRYAMEVVGPVPEGYLSDPASPS